jgi:hypothetical protein
VPPLNPTLHSQVLRELSVPVKMCDGDSTPVILGMARQMKCGVLSRDSAYFLHEVPQGYIPIHRVQIKGGSLTMQASQRTRAPLSAATCDARVQVYNCGALASVIFGMKPQLVSLWSSLAGAPIGHETGIRLFQRRAFTRILHQSHVTLHITPHTRVLQAHQGQVQIRRRGPALFPRGFSRHCSVAQPVRARTSFATERAAARCAVPCNCATV